MWMALSAPAAGHPEERHDRAAPILDLVLTGTGTSVRWSGSCCGYAWVSSPVLSAAV